MATRQVRTRQRMLDAAARVLAKNSGASTQEIAAAADVGRATLHRYFPTREQLLGALALDALDRTEAAVRASEPETGPSTQAWYRLARALVPLGPQMYYLLFERSLESDPQVMARLEGIAQTFDRVTERGKSDGGVRAQVPTAWVTDAFTALLWGAWQAVEDGRLAPRDAPGLVADTMLRGVG